MTKMSNGKIRGKMIELTEDLGLNEGQEVEVRVTVLPSARPWGEGLLRCAGALADDSQWDAIMDEIHQARKLERRCHLEDE